MSKRKITGVATLERSNGDGTWQLTFDPPLPSEYRSKTMPYAKATVTGMFILNSVHSPILHYGIKVGVSTFYRMLKSTARKASMEDFSRVLERELGYSLLESSAALKIRALDKLTKEEKEALGL